jgi:hypothetical protein
MSGSPTMRPELVKSPHSPPACCPLGLQRSWTDAGVAKRVIQ